jgi:hypothetical protein
MIHHDRMGKTRAGEEGGGTLGLGPQRLLAEVAGLEHIRRHKERMAQHVRLKSEIFSVG